MTSHTPRRYCRKHGHVLLYTRRVHTDGRARVSSDETKTTAALIPGMAVCALLRN